MKLNNGKLRVTLPGDCEIRVTREFAAPRRLVFDAHTQPAMVQQWLFGPEGWSLPVCQIDLRVGGRYRYVWRHEDGREFATGGTYLEIVPPEKLVSSERFEGAMDQGEAINTLEFVERAGKTLITLTMRFPSQEVRDGAIRSGMTGGMELGYARLETILPSIPAAPSGT